MIPKHNFSITFLNEPELIFSQLKGFTYFLMLIILLEKNYFLYIVEYFQVLQFNTKNSIKH